MRKIAQLMRWIDDHNREPRRHHGMRDSYFLWMLTSFCATAGAFLLFRVHEHGWLPPLFALVATTLLFAAGLVFYLFSLRAMFMIISALFAGAAIVWSSFGIWPPLTFVLATLAVISLMLNLVAEPALTGHHHDPFCDPPTANEQPKQASRKAAA